MFIWQRVASNKDVENRTICFHISFSYGNYGLFTSTCVRVTPNPRPPTALCGRLPNAPIPSPHPGLSAAGAKPSIPSGNLTVQLETSQLIQL